MPDPTRRPTAVVVGGSVSGLFAATALLDHADVTLIERDQFPEGPAPRRGVPQARHAHLVWYGGVVAFDQLLPGLVGDPFGRGWDLLGPAADGLDATPFGAAGLLWLRIVLLGVLVVAAAVVAARGVPQPVRVAAFVSLAYLGAVSMLVVALH